MATPIGTLADIGDRAREVLADVDLILAEDTRRTRRLLAHLGLGAGRRLQSLHEHNEEGRLPSVLAALRGGRSVALVSDAGTPVLSDPGYLLVRSARMEGIPVLSVPGPSAFTAALAAAGQPPLPALLVGFLPPRTGARRQRIAELAALPYTLVVLLSPHRLARELSDLASELDEDRPATLLAELSKSHERGSWGSLGELAAGAEAEAPRGEYVLVVGPPQATVPAEKPGCSRAQVRAAYERALAAGDDRRQALRRVGRDLGMSRREVYESLLDDETDAVGER